VRAVAAVFEVKKPFFNLDAGNVFAQLGNVRHRGIEASLTGQPIEGLTMVAGTVLLQARVTGPAVALGRTGRVPLGRYPHIVRLNLQYGPKAWRGLALDGQVENQSARYGDLLNTMRVPSATIFTMGGRYTFKVNDVNAMLRAQVQNVTNEFNWVPSATGQYFVLEQRRFTVSLTADF
jgi:iron complex outermembrane receptor protein